ncbi:glycosyltransferase family 2 protein [Paludibacterium paludis]|uniref:Glycosyltransferase EpsH n=1 Tax=Paludibacterium paludis TaxID=1225769 RepID=A0A918P2Y0_9NEIS|nr:glycosyltransferase family A protein [Paludibacterium paludis]GGY15724.1 putative glycosyltransferase EpsH [Paludibacterium paludis]
MLPTVSLVLTTYNDKPYIDQAIQSVLSQSHTDFECIIIDDGSTDGTAEICRKYADTDPRIRVITQSNSGASAARNVGIGEARGTWLAFVDSDDILHPDFISDCLYACMHNPCDLVICEAVVFADGSAPDFPETADTEMENEEAPAALRKLLEGEYIPNVWARLYRRECLAGTGFPLELVVGEDMEFSVRLMLRLSRVCHVNLPRYAYRKRDGSVLSRFKPELLSNRLSFCRAIQTTLGPSATREPLSRSLQIMAATHLGYYGMKDMVRSGVMNEAWLFAMRDCLSREFDISAKQLPALGLPTRREKWLKFALGPCWLAKLFLKYQIRKHKRDANR